MDEICRAVTKKKAALQKPKNITRMENMQRNEATGGEKANSNSRVLFSFSGDCPPYNGAAVSFDILTEKLLTWIYLYADIYVKHHMI